MKLSDIDPHRLTTLLANDGVVLQTGPFVVNVKTHEQELVQGLGSLYGDVPVIDDAEFCDFYARVDKPAGLRRWLKPQINFYFDGTVPFNPFPQGQALPLFEWGLNWSVSQNAHQYLIVHAAVIEKNGRAVIMPAPPGSGKSTLCAGLVNSGWRLLSDELTLFRLSDGCIVPLARPVGLKNESIDVIQQFAPQAVISPVTHDTHKGSVALMRPPRESVERVDEVALPAWIIFPKYSAGTEAMLSKHSKAAACLSLGDNAFNYSIHGAEGFRVLTETLDRCHCFDFIYSQLSDAVEVFDNLPAPL